jgi:hypothetical protein
MMVAEPVEVWLLSLPALSHVEVSKYADETDFCGFYYLRKSVSSALLVLSIAEVSAFYYVFK